MGRCGISAASSKGTRPGSASVSLGTEEAVSFRAAAFRLFFVETAFFSSALQERQSLQGTRGNLRPRTCREGDQTTCHTPFHALESRSLVVSQGEKEVKRVLLGQLLHLFHCRIRQIQAELILRFQVTGDSGRISSKECKEPCWVMFGLCHSYVRKSDLPRTLPNGLHLNVNISFRVNRWLFPQVCGNISCENLGWHLVHRLARGFLLLRGSLRHNHGDCFKRRRRTGKCGQSRKRKLQ